MRIEHNFFKDSESDELIEFYKTNPDLSILYNRKIDNYYSSQLSIRDRYSDFLFSKRIQWPYEAFTRLNIQQIDDTQEVLERHHQHIQKYSIIVFLNDDFIGGNLMFDDILIKPVKNMMITFSKELGHHVKKVNKGARYTLVGFSDVELEIEKYSTKIII